MQLKLRDEILDLCQYLKFTGIKKHFEEELESASDYEDYLLKLLRYEVEEKEKCSVECRMRSAHFPYRKYLEDLEINELPETMQQRLPELATLDFIEKGKNLIMIGNPGTGKTHIALGLGIKACLQGYKVLYTTIPFLVTELKECNSQKRLRYFQNRFEKYDLVIADELGYISFDREGTELLFNNLSLRAGRKSMIVTSNLTFARWTEVFIDPAITNALVDRLTHKSIIVDMNGDSYRLKETLSLKEQLT
ncbi:MAG TPA: ATP-binding protein [Candidatus Merdenecus merdavium]|nr:ATP-binding protein [Candidatus Merdenecus merdavium]